MRSSGHVCSRNGEDVEEDLRDVFRRQGDVLKNQISFTDCGMTFKQYRDEADFAASYPFAPYQFQLIQKIFEAIRRVGATGAHSSPRRTFDAGRLPIGGEDRLGERGRRPRPPLRLLSRDRELPRHRP